MKVMINVGNSQYFGYFFHFIIVNYIMYMYLSKFYVSFKNRGLNYITIYREVYNVLVKKNTFNKDWVREFGLLIIFKFDCQYF